MLKKVIPVIAVALAFNCSHAAAPQLSNQEIAAKFLSAVVNEKDFSEASKYIGASYTEHDPDGQDGGGVGGYIQFLREVYPNSYAEVKRVVASGDLVMFHVHHIMTPNTRGNAVVDIFRLDHGKVVEHWDIVQEVPEHSANGNGMF